LNAAGAMMMIEDSDGSWKRRAPTTIRRPAAGSFRASPADAGNLAKIAESLEWTILFPMREDAIRQFRPDARSKRSSVRSARLRSILAIVRLGLGGCQSATPVADVFQPMNPRNASRRRNRLA